jgi:hypothetical protein
MWITNCLTLLKKMDLSFFSHCPITGSYIFSLVWAPYSFFLVVLGLELRAYTLSHSASLIFVLVFF